MNYKWCILAVLLIFLVAPSSAWLSGNVTVIDTVYSQEETTVPLVLLCLIIVLGVLFLVSSFIADTSGRIIILSIIGMMFLAAGAFAAPVTAITTQDAITAYNATTGETGIMLVPFSALVVQPWISWILWGMFLVGLINIGARGVGGMLLDARNSRDEWEI